MSQKETLLKTLFDDPTREHVDIKFMRGTSEKVSEDDFCREINSAIFQFDNKLIEAVDSVEDDFPQVDVRHLALHD